MSGWIANVEYCPLLSACINPTNYKLPDWQAAGQDQHATENVVTKSYTAPAKPTVNKISLLPNRYDPDRAHIFAYNWAGGNTVTVAQADVSQILSLGDIYALHNVQDYYNDIITGSYSGGDLVIPMTGHTVQVPLGENTVVHTSQQAPITSTFPEFGAFVLEKK